MLHDTKRRHTAGRKPRPTDASRRARLAAGVAALMVLGPGAPGAHAQAPTPRCSPTASLGIAQWVVRNGSISTDSDGSVRYEFRTEPTIAGVRAGGPGVGRLRAGDVLVAVDAHLITTPAGWRRLEEIETGDRVMLRVRRDGRELDVAVVADEYCRPPPAQAPDLPALPDPPRVPRAAPTPPPGALRMPRAPRLAPLPVPPAYALTTGPRAVIGFSFECSRCVGRLVRDSTADPGSERIRWEFSEPPLLKAVTRDGPAWKGGLRSGDRLLAVDGARITTPEGWERFSGFRPGRPIRLEVDRDGSSRTFRVTPDSVRAGGAYMIPTPAPDAPNAPGAPGARRRPFADAESTLRYSDVLGGVAIEVRGEPANTFYDAEKGELIIRAPGTWIRLKLTDDRR